MSEELEPGQKWRSPDRSTWSVSRVGNGIVWMSGPGPCRGISHFDLDVVRDEWTPLCRADRTPWLEPLKATR
jgi:hypothetical protein